MSADEIATTPRATSPIGPDSTRITDPKEFLELSSAQLDAIFGASTTGPIPVGQGEGSAIIAPGTEFADLAEKLIHWLNWKGKVFEHDEARPGHAWLKNRLGIFGKQAIAAEVYKGTSWYDGKECIVLDYSHSSLIAKYVRDEIREVGPGMYLGLVYWGEEKDSSHRLIHFALKF